MKHLIIFALILIGMFLGGLQLMANSITADPYPLRENTIGLYSSPELAFETYVIARNSKDFELYHECLGKNPETVTTYEDEKEMKLWGTIDSYEIDSVERNDDMVRITVFEDFIAANGREYPGQRTQYYYIDRGGRYILLEASSEQRILWFHHTVFSIF